MTDTCQLWEKIQLSHVIKEGYILKSMILLHYKYVINTVKKNNLYQTIYFYSYLISVSFLCNLITLWANFQHFSSGAIWHKYLWLGIDV